MDITLSKATAHDFEFLLDLRLKTMDEHLKNAGVFLSANQHRARVSEKFELSHLISVSDQKIGFVKFVTSARTITVFQIQILPEYQGKGYGKHVLNRFISEGKLVCLSVLKLNPAYMLYKQLGFKAVGEDEYEYHLEYRHTPLLTRS